MLVPTNESKKKKQYRELWSKINDSIRSITKNSYDYDEKYIKIKFESDDNLPLNKTIEISIMTIVVRTVFHANKKYHPQVFLDNCLYKLSKFYIMIGLLFPKELILIKQTHQECDICHYWYFLNIVLSFNQMFAIDVMIY